MSWESDDFKIYAYSYKCGYCGNEVGSNRGVESDTPSIGDIHICPVCREPTYHKGHEIQVPAPIYGNDVQHLPQNIEELYKEARSCMQVNAFTSSVMACRKLLMNIAVEKDAEEGKNYAYYVDFLEKNHFTPPDSKDWVDHIRTKGNEANHEIDLKSKKDAIDLINFIEMLLKFIYEFKGKIKAKKEGK